MNESLCDKPLAGNPFRSYRYRGRYGWIMIGAMDHCDALLQAKRSLPWHDKTWFANLEVWDGTRYVPAQDTP